MARRGAQIGALTVTAVAACVAACTGAYDAAEPDPVTTPRDDAEAPDATTQTQDAGDAAQPTGPCTAPLTDGWSTPVRLSTLSGGANEQYFVDPFVTADGLTLLVVNTGGTSTKVYRATRPSRDAAWSTANELTGSGGQPSPPLYPTTAAPEEEIVITGIYSQADPHTLRRVDGGVGWGAEVILPLSRPDLDWYPTLTSDGLMIVYQQARGGADPYRILMQSTRSTIGATWANPQGLASPAFDGGAGSVSWHYPALTPNGLGLFYALETNPEIPYVVTRSTRAGEFFANGALGAPIASLSVKGYATRVRSITADGCEMYLTSDRDGLLDVYVSKRSP